MIKVYSIVFMQRDSDIEQMLQDLKVESLSDVSDKDLLNYLSQWEQGQWNHHDSNNYDESQIDTEFLGYRIDKRRTKSGYLLSRNESLGYVGLSYFEKVA